MLSDHERRTLDELEKSFAREVGRRDPRGPARRQLLSDRHPVLAAAGVVLPGAFSIFLLVTGAALGAVSIAAATALGWLLVRFWPQIRAAAADPDVPENGGAQAKLRSRRPDRGQGAQDRRFGSEEE